MEHSVTAIHGLLDDWAEAEHRGDVTALRDLLDDAFVGVGPDGQIFDKAAWLERYRSGDLVNHVFSWRILEGRARGPTVVIVGQLDQISSYRGRDASACLTVTLALGTLAPASRLLGLHASAPLRR